MTGGPKARAVAERIMDRVTVSDSGCWEWDTPSHAFGYGQIWVGSRSDGTRRSKLAHVASYEAFVGPVPAGLNLDHLCRNPRCVNPEHLEPVTQRENLMRSPVAPAALEARRTHCKYGHEYTPENTYLNKGKRYCRACIRNRP